MELTEQTIQAPSTRFYVPVLWHCGRSLLQSFLVQKLSNRCGWTNPRRRPRHLAHDPFELVAPFLPLHGGARDVTAVGGELRHEVIALVEQFHEVLLREGGGVALLVHERSSAVSGVSQDGVENRPDDSVATQGAESSAVMEP